MGLSRFFPAILFILPSFLFLAGCEEKLPVEYVICDIKSEKCQLSARFKDTKSCEFFKELSGIYCDRESNPDLIVCDQKRKSKVATSICR